MSEKIMIVDDDPAITMYLEALFTDHGYETCIADDGKAALELYETEKPDLITLDLEMPEEWGPRFFRKISKAQGFSTPVIVISGLSGRQHSIPKAQGFFPKPFDPEAVIDKVKELLSS